MQVLDGDIKADERGVADYEKTIKQLSSEREDIEKRLRSNEEWAATYDRDIAPLLPALLVSRQ